MPNRDSRHRLTTFLICLKGINRMAISVAGFWLQAVPLISPDYCQLDN